MHYWRRLLLAVAMAAVGALGSAGPAIAYGDDNRCYDPPSSILCTSVNYYTGSPDKTFAMLDPSLTGAYNITIGNQMCNGYGDSCGTQSARSDTSGYVFYSYFSTSFKDCSFGHTYKAFGSWTEYQPRNSYTSVWTPLFAPYC